MSSPPVTVARHAMATRFEIALHGGNPVSLRAAAEEALAEIERIEGQLSLYRPSSEIARVNARAAREPVRVSPPVFRLLEHAARLSAESGGAFDITIGPLMKCWGFVGGSGRMPDPAALDEARACVGMHQVELDAGHFTVRFARDGVMLDLGAIGKGYAIGAAAEILREAGVTSALIHGGTSTAYAIGRPPDADAWKVAIARPPQIPSMGSQLPAGESGAHGPLLTSVPASPEQPCLLSRPAGTLSSAPSGGEGRGEEDDFSLQANLGDATPPEPAPPPILAVVPLRDEALSVSAVWGKFFQSDGTTFGHVLDPRTGRPAGDTFLAAVALPDATETDALSTALLVLGGAGLSAIRRLRPTARALVAGDRHGILHGAAVGLELNLA